MPEHSQGQPFVYLDQPANANDRNLVSFISERRDEVLERLHDLGSVLFRGFARAADDGSLGKLARLVAGGELFGYVGGASPRTSLGRGLYTSTEYPASLELPLHNELSYSARFPRYLFFECITPAASGGETTLGDSRQMLVRISPAIVSEFRSKGILYERHLHCSPGDGYSWQEAFATDSRKEVLSRCAGIAADAEFLCDGTLRMIQKGRATTRHPITGEEVWFNQAAGFHSSNIDAGTRSSLAEQGLRPRLEARFGDGSAIPDETIAAIHEAFRQEAVEHAWQAGDVIAVDNVLTAHGRMPFTGPRRIALAMA